MRKLQFNWGVVLAVIVLLAYTYYAFMGCLYMWDGKIWKALLAALAIIVVVTSCVYMMSLARATKWKDIGIIGQSFFGVIILAVFILASFPFTGFVQVHQDSDTISSSIASVKKDAMLLDSSYNAYAAQRVAAYRTSLNSTQYADIKVASLHRHLMPKGIGKSQQQRKEWLQSLGEMSVWNVYLPNNLHYLTNCVNEWIANYQQLSGMSYAEENSLSNRFDYNIYESSLAELTSRLKKPKTSFLAILLAVFSAALMLVPYLLMDRAPAAKAANQGGNLINPFV